MQNLEKWRLKKVKAKVIYEPVWNCCNYNIFERWSYKFSFRNMHKHMRMLLVSDSVYSDTWTVVLGLEGQNKVQD